MPPAVMPACTTASCWVKRTMRIGLVLKNIRAKRSSRRSATKRASSSRATLPLGSLRRCLQAQVQRIDGAPVGRHHALVHAAAAVDQQHDLRAVPGALDGVSGRRGPATASAVATMASAASSLQAQPSAAPARSAGSHGRCEKTRASRRRGRQQGQRQQQQGPGPRTPAACSWRVPPFQPVQPPAQYLGRHGVRRQAAAEEQRGRLGVEGLDLRLQRPQVGRARTAPRGSAHGLADRAVEGLVQHAMGRQRLGLPAQRAAGRGRRAGPVRARRSILHRPATRPAWLPGRPPRAPAAAAGAPWRWRARAGRGAAAAAGRPRPARSGGRH